MFCRGETAFLEKQTNNKKYNSEKEMGPPGGVGTTAVPNVGEVEEEEGGGGMREKGRGPHEVMAARCFGIIARKNSIPAVVIYHVHQSAALRGWQIDRQET